MKNLNLFLGLFIYVMAGVLFMIKRYNQAGNETEFQWMNYLIWLCIVIGLFFIFRWIYLILKYRKVKQ